MSGWQWWPILRVTQRDLLAQLRSRSFLVQTLLLPMILTFIIGNALGGSRSPEPSPVVIVGTENRVTKALADVLTVSQLARIQYTSKAVGQQMLETGKAIVLIEFPENPERTLLRGREFPILVMLDSASFFRGTVIQSVVQGFAQQLQTTRATLLGAVRALKPATAQELAALLPTVQQQVQADFEARAPQITARQIQGQIGRAHV